ncbi:MAG: hypothetical protein IJL63_06945 [Clostridia bacterium]|nr:hypothetical protein [Clostridia bacterium]
MEHENRNVTFLEKVYDNAAMGEEAINMLSEKVEDEKMMNELKWQTEQYTTFSHDAHMALTELGAEPKNPSTVSKLGLWSGIQLNTLMSKSNDKLAEIMIQGSTMGIIDMARVLREYEDVPEAYLEIARRLIDFLEESVDRMKNFLG